MLRYIDPVLTDVILREESAPPPFPPAANRAAWAAIRATIGEARCQSMIAAAERAASEPVPALPATLFLEFFRSGDRRQYETPWFRRREMLADLALAECLEYSGRFLDPLLNVAWAICEESSWELPAHHHDLPDETPEIGLFAALTATQLAEVVLLLGAECHPLLEQRIRREVDQRILTPFLTRHNFWWLHPKPGRKLNNWTGVCVGNLIAAAVYLEPDPARLAEIIARGAHSLDDYLATFDSEGGSTEGPAYWDFGFGNYVLAAHLVHQRTNGRIDFFAEPVVRQIAQFPLRTMLSPNTFVNFSDCDANIRLVVPLLVCLARHYGLDDLMRLANMQHKGGPFRSNGALSWKLRQVVWWPDPALDQRAIPARHDWYPEIQWMIARLDPADPDTLMLAAKGGHNDEMHNQNDVGNLIVHIRGVSVIADIGRGRYTRQYFRDDTRYNFLVNTSLGHSLPVPNGCAQQTGEQYAARLLDHQAAEDCDRLVLDLKDAYPPEARLAALTRTVALHRDTLGGWVELVDEVAFTENSAPFGGSFESALTTFGAITVGPDAVRIEDGGAALSVHYDPALVTARVEVIEAVDLATGPRDVRRVIFALAEAQIKARVAARIALRILPI